MGTPSPIVTNPREGPRPIAWVGELSLVPLRSQSLYAFLAWIDTNLAEQSRSRGCPRCGGPLHRSGWHRKPRGAPADISDECLVRHGLCCGHCRRRTLPSSCLYDGRRVYWRSVVLLVVALRQTRPGSVSIGMVCRRLGVSRQTVRRWSRYFLEIFPTTPTWQTLRGRVGAQVHDGQLPSDVMRLFGPDMRFTAHVLVRSAVFFATGIAPLLFEIAEG